MIDPSSSLKMDIIGEIIEEIKRAEAKHSDWPTDIVHASAILNEEAGELTQAALDWHYKKRKGLTQVQREAIQTGAMAVRFLMNMGEYSREVK